MVPLAATFAILLSRAVAAEPISTFPTPLPVTRAACAAFTPEADYIDQTLIMQLEGREIGLRVPKVFLEDVWDLRPGFSDTAQLFQVEIGSFLPVTRAETGRRNKQDIWNWMIFVVSDRIVLEDIAVLSAELRSQVIGGRLGRRLASYESLPGPFELVEIRSDASQPSAAFRSQTLLSLSKAEGLSAVLSCNLPGSVAYPVCLHWFRAAGMDVELQYRRTELPNWQALQDDVTVFLSCLTRPSP